MALTVRLGRELFIAPFAGEGALAGVRAKVAIQRAPVRALITTMLARITTTSLRARGQR